MWLRLRRKRRQELPLAHAHRRRHVRHRQPPVAPLLDGEHRLRHRVVVEELPLRRGTRHQARLHVQVPAPPRAARHQPVEVPCRAVADGLVAEVDRRERHGRRQAHGGIVPRRHDPHVVGHPQPLVQAELGEGPSEVHADRDDAHGLRQLVEPCSQVVAEPRPRGGPPVAAERVQIDGDPPVLAARIAEALLEQARRAVVEVAEQGEVVVGVRCQVSGGEDARAAAVRDDAGEVHRHHAARRGDIGHARVPRCLRDRAAARADDAVVADAAAPQRIGVSHGEPPSRLLAGEAMDPAHDLTRREPPTVHIERHGDTTAIGHDSLPSQWPGCRVPDTGCWTCPPKPRRRRMLDPRSSSLTSDRWPLMAALCPLTADR